jgi:hypothetical protein
MLSTIHVPHVLHSNFIEASEENIVKRLFGYALMLTLTAAPALAAKNSQSINLAQPVKVGSTQLTAGDYKVSWTGTGDAVQVTLNNNGKSITVPAKMVTEKHDHKGYTVNRVAGNDQLETIQFSNMSLQLQSSTASGQ